MRTSIKVGMIALGVGGVAFGLHSTPASAQYPTPMMTVPGPGTTAGGNVSGKILTTNGRWQVVFAAVVQSGENQAIRKGCIIQNNSPHTLYISEGTTTGSATTTTSFLLTTTSPQNVFYCNVAGGPTTLQGEVDISGTTTTDAFYAVAW